MSKLFLLLALLLMSFDTPADQSVVENDIDAMHFCFSRWWPYNYSEHGVAKGMQIDILKMAMQDSGVSLSFTELPFKRCKDYVRLGKYDFVLDIDETDELDMVRYSISSWQLSFAVEVNSGIKNIHDIEALKDFRVILAQEYDYPDSVLSKLKNLNAVIGRVSYYESTDEDAKALFAILKNSHVEAMLVDRFWAKQVVRKHQLPVLVFEEPVHIEPQFIGYVAKQTKAKAEFLETKLKELSVNKIEKIRKQYR
ncbi:substrate-binding periplasmic protein [Pseudoalteromonas sp. S16_S37]|uniref:substrate-binding periplasmic protein n=1 Tax=Pseudoalteromonas sp. S16_S37 TaxID=2720228 RepID=UPI0016802573|nr:transporter substrate-binding domain-containing protein [Pseudoalteromonas sp. S16_S37]MBD1584145.1 amino acid ABC transporter substrate-binding protein [Pseudoalteromonas sp. S16_S37]